MDSIEGGARRGRSYRSYSGHLGYSMYPKARSASRTSVGGGCCSLGTVAVAAAVAAAVRSRSSRSARARAASLAESEVSETGPATDDEIRARFLSRFGESVEERVRLINSFLLALEEDRDRRKDAEDREQLFVGRVVGEEVAEVHLAEGRDGSRQRRPAAAGDAHVLGGVLGALAHTKAAVVEGGDGFASGSEVCDGTDLQGEACATLGFIDGMLACNVSCDDYDVSACFGCGNGTIDGAEVCDGDDLGGETCESLGTLGGELGCQATCDDFDLSACFVQ